MSLRENEKTLYGGNVSQPCIIISYNSTVLQNANLMEFNGEKRLQYYRRTYRIITGAATDQDLKLAILISCHTHIMAQNKPELGVLETHERPSTVLSIQLWYCSC